MKSVVLILSMLLAYPTHGVELHTGLNGPWHAAEKAGQGLVLHIIPEINEIFIAWFTYTEAGGEQMWLTAHGNLNNPLIELTIYESTNGKLNSNQPLPEQQVWGTGSIEFSSCLSAKFTFTGSDDLAGSIDLTRVTSPINCSET